VNPSEELDQDEVVPRRANHELVMQGDDLPELALGHEGRARRGAHVVHGLAQDGLDPLVDFPWDALVVEARLAHPRNKLQGVAGDGHHNMHDCEKDD